MLKIIEIKTQEEKENLKSFLKENSASLLQDFAWGEFQKATEKKVWNLAVVDDSFNFYAAAQIIKHNLPFERCYLYCPKGPISNFQSCLPAGRFPISNQFPISKFSKNQVEKILKLLVNYIKWLTKQENAVFLRIEPEILVGDQEKILTPAMPARRSFSEGGGGVEAEVLKNLGFKKSQKEIQPRDTLILDLAKLEEKLLSEMHPKTRYNIRLAEKRGVKIRQSVSQKDLEVFYQLLQKTANRDRFFSHPKEYYQKQLEILGRENYLQLFLAEYNKETIAGILVSFYNERAAYLHGAHNANFRNLMAPHLLQMSAILEAKKRGCKIYDFWGIAPQNAPENHPWCGITRFKRGFGGKEINYVGGWDWVFSKSWYFLYNLSHQFRI